MQFNYALHTLSASVNEHQLHSKSIMEIVITAA